LCDGLSRTQRCALSLHDALPISEFGSWQELEAYVARQNAAYLARPHPDRREMTIGEALELERRHLRSLPAVPFPCYAEIPVSARSEEHTSELQSRENLVCRLLLE